VVRAYA